MSFSLNYTKVDRMELIGYADADWNNALDSKSISGYCFFLAHASSPISWKTRKQDIVATSTCNAEYVSISEAAHECIWIQKLLKNLDMNNMHWWPAQFFCDNTGALSLAENPGFDKRSRHIEMRFHHIRDHVELGTIKLKHIASKSNIADGFTKSLPAPTFKIFQNFMENHSQRKMFNVSHQPYM